MQGQVLIKVRAFDYVDQNDNLLTIANSSQVSELQVARLKSCKVGFGLNDLLSTTLMSNLLVSRSLNSLELEA